MKYIKVSLLSFLLIPAAASFAAVDVQWVNPEKFADATYQNMDTEKSREVALKEVQSYIDRLAERNVPEGYTLTLRVTDVDLEGEFEPFRQAGFDDVRIVKDIYPARLKFEYTLANPNGEVVAEGTESLRHSMVVRPTPVNSSERYPYTRDLLEGWFRKTVRDVKKAGEVAAS